MSVPKWRGSAIDVRQVATITIANTWTAADTITVTIDNLDFVVTIGSLVTTTQVATTLYQALTGTTFTDTTASCVPSIAQGGAPIIGNFAEVTATNPSAGVVSLTTNQTLRVGKPVTITVTESTASTGTATYAVTIVPHGRNEADNQDNYDTNAVPVDNDTVVFDAGDVDFLYDLTFNAQFATIIKTMGYTGKVGLAEINTDNTAIGKSYREYRGKYLVTDDNTVTTTANLETGTGQGSGRFRWNAGAGAAVVNVFGRGTRELAGIPCILWLGTNAANVVNNIAGDLGIAFYPGETSTVATLRNGDGPSSQAETYCGTGCTLTTVICNGGKLYTTSAITTATLNGGEWKHDTGTVTAANVLGGSWNHLGGATITTLTVGSGGKFDASKGTATFAITNTVQLYKGSEFYDPQGRSGNVVFKLNNCTLNDVKVTLAPNKTYSLS